ARPLLLCADRRVVDRLCVRGRAREGRIPAAAHSPLRGRGHGRGARRARAAPRLRAALERLLEADAQLVVDVRAETPDLLETGRAVEPERLVLANSRLQANPAIAEVARLFFERAQHPAGKAGAAMFGRHVHPPDLSRL